MSYGYANSYIGIETLYPPNFSYRVASLVSSSGTSMVVANCQLYSGICATASLHSHAVPLPLMKFIRHS